VRERREVRAPEIAHVRVAALVDRAVVQPNLVAV
jgi:hypothetical protein